MKEKRKKKERRNIAHGIAFYTTSEYFETDFFFEGRYSGYFSELLGSAAEALHRNAPFAAGYLSHDFPCTIAKHCAKIAPFAKLISKEIFCPPKSQNRLDNERTFFQGGDDLEM